MSRLLVVVAFIAACGGKLPETRYYQLAAPANARPPAAGNVALTIEPLETDQAYDDERIVYRTTPYRLDYYNYHRWSSPPGALIADFLERAFEASGQFASVTRQAQGAPLTLGGRVIAIEEIDRSHTAWVGRIVIELRLVDANGTVVWTQQYEEHEALQQQSPEGLAQALSVALHRIAGRALPIVADHAAQIARTQDSAKATPARAAKLKP